MSPLAADVLAEATAKSALCIGLAGLASLALRRRSAAERHLCWAAALIAGLLMPALVVLLPRWQLPVGSGCLPDRARVEAGDRAAMQTEWSLEGDGTHPLADSVSRESGRRRGTGLAQAETWSWLSRVDVVRLWGLGALLASCPLALASVHVVRLVRRAQRLSGERWTRLLGEAALASGVLPRRLDLRRAQGPVTPLTWGVLRPVVILPDGCEAWNDAQVREVLIHELGHVRRRDCLTQFLASGACVLYWFNPLVWFAARRMLVERERACDDLVLLSGARASDYASDLLELARAFGAPWSTAHVTTAMARRSQIAGRLLAVLDPGLARRGVGRRSVWLAAALTALASLPVASAQRSLPVESATGTASRASAQEPRAAARFDLEGTEAAISARQRAYAGAFARRDLDALASFYTEDARVAGQAYPLVHGRGGARSLLQLIVDQGFDELRIDTRELYPVGDLVCEVGEARWSAASGSSTVTNRFMTLWKWQDGTWRIHRDWAVVE